MIGVPLASVGPLNLPLGAVPQRLSAVEPNIVEQLADLRIEILAMRNLFDVALELLASGADVRRVAQTLRFDEPGRPQAHTSGCRCALHARKAA